MSGVIFYEEVQCPLWIKKDDDRSMANNFIRYHFMENGQRKHKHEYLHKWRREETVRIE